MKNNSKKLVFDSFSDFMTEYVLPRKAERGDKERLDGKTGPGTRVAAAYFEHQGRRWKVDADTRYKPLQVAYDYFLETGNDPFIEHSTKVNHRKLVLNEILSNDLKQKYKTRGTYLYIYAPRVKS